MSLDVHICDENGDTIYSANITHNLVPMANELGVYPWVWRPEENGIEKASQLIPILTAGLVTLAAEPERFKAFNPPNGWGDYEGFVDFIAGYLEACRAAPEGYIYAFG